MNNGEILDVLAVFCVCGLSITLMIGFFWLFLIIVEWFNDKNF